MERLEEGDDKLCRKTIILIFDKTFFIWRKRYPAKITAPSAILVICYYFPALLNICCYRRLDRRGDLSLQRLSLADALSFDKTVELPTLPQII